LAAEPRCTVTTPVREMATLAASPGMRMTGCTGVALARDERALIGDLERAVARVGGLPVAELHLEEPLASMATSSGRLVVSSIPCACSRWTAASRVPRPTWMAGAVWLSGAPITALLCMVW
jgi:hypothetical protein